MFVNEGKHLSEHLESTLHAVFLSKFRIQHEGREGSLIARLGTHLVLRSKIVQGGLIRCMMDTIFLAAALHIALIRSF